MSAAKLRLPYPTIVGLSQALAILGRTRPGTRIDRAFLLGEGFPPNSVAPLLDALGFLGLVGAGGVLGCGARRFVADPAPAARAALRPVLGRLRPPYADRKALTRAMRPLVERPDTTLPLAATFLDWLGGKAGIELIRRVQPKPGARAGVSRARRPAPVLWARVRAAEREHEHEHEHERERERAGKAAAPAAKRAGMDAAAVTIQIVIDRNTTDADLDRMIREAKEAIGRLRADGVW